MQPLTPPSALRHPVKSLKALIKADNYLFIQYISNSLNGILALKGET